MPLPKEKVIEAIDTSPYNRGVRGIDWLASKLNVPVTFDNGDIALFEDEGDGDFYVHFLLVSRGRKAVERVREAFRFMFENYHAEAIFGFIPDANRKMKLVARWAGAKSFGLHHMSEGLCELFIITKPAFYKGMI